MTILGLRTDENFVTNQRPENWRQTMLLLYPNGKMPLTALTGMMRSESTDDPVYHWWEKGLQTRRLKLDEELDNSETAITVDATYSSAFQVKAGDVLYAEATGELMRVASNPTAADTITVVRARGGTTATAVALATQNPYLLVVGSNFEEGSLAPSGVNFDPTENSNYCQIFRSALEMTRTASKTRLRTGDAVKEAKRECLEYFGIDMERAFFFNANKTLATINSQPARLTSGLIYQIPAANKVAAPSGGLITMDWLDARMVEIFAQGSSEKVVFASNTVLNAINQAVRKNSTYNIQSGVKEYGMNVTRIIAPYGELVFKTHPLFNQMTGGTGTDGSTVYTSMANNAVILDMANIRYRYVDDVKYEKDLQTTGLDGMKAGYLAECGLELHHATTHFYWTGITGGDVDA